MFRCTPYTSISEWCGECRSIQITKGGTFLCARESVKVASKSAISRYVDCNKLLVLFGQSLLLQRWHTSCLRSFRFKTKEIFLHFFFAIDGKFRVVSVTFIDMNENCAFVAVIVLNNFRHRLFKQLWIYCGLLYVFRPSPTYVAVVLRATTLQLTYLPVQGRTMMMIIIDIKILKYFICCHPYFFVSAKLMGTLKTTRGQ